jgi:hypothetical protein
MTQEPQNPEPSKPSEPPTTSAWAPRSDPSSPTPETRSDATPDPDTSPDSDTATDHAAPSEPGEPAPDPATEPVATAPASVAIEPETHETVVAAPARRSGIPAWLLVVAAIVPAVIVGLIVFFLLGSDDADDSPSAAAGIVDGLMRLGQADQANITSFEGELPPEFAPDFPIYEDAEVVVSIAMASEQGTGYLIVMSTPDSTSEVYEFYNTRLDAEPWQVEIGRSSAEFTGLRFLRPDNIDVSGDVSLHRSELGDRTVIYLSYSDISQAILPGGDTSPFSLGPTRPLPVGFPGDIPIYQGAEESVILDTYFERGQGGQAFIVTFLTRDSQDDVIEFYRQDFEGKGWVVSDAGVESTSFALGIEFDDGPAQSISGTITADSFENDPAYTQVDLLVTTRSN